MPIEFSLTKGYVTVVDDCDADLQFPKWQAEVTNSGLIYAARKHLDSGRSNKTTIKLHRVILERMLGRALQSGEVVDHVNCDGLDNRRTNLRLATRQQNQANARRRSDNKSGYKGVIFDKARNKWRAEIRSMGIRKYLGRFDTADEAYRAYCDAATILFGEFANFGGR
jgi:hypothetical protein